MESFGDDTISAQNIVIPEGLIGNLVYCIATIGGSNLRQVDTPYLEFDSQGKMNCRGITDVSIGG